MKSKIIFQEANTEANEKAEKLGLEHPSPTFSNGEVHFDASYIHLAYLNSKSEIVAYFPSGSWVLEYNEKVWEDIKIHLGKNNGVE